MLESLSKTSLTPRCKHKARSDGSCDNQSKARIGPDVAVFEGGSLDRHTRDHIAERIVILATGGEPYLRWMALHSREHLSDIVIDMDGSRMVMLRNKKCCNACALDFTAFREGNWVLIL